MQLPHALHAQLYLLAWDRERRSFDLHRRDRWVMDFALSSAALTDLYLSGYIEDRGGTLHRTKPQDPADATHRRLLAGAEGRDWIDLITRKERTTRAQVHEELRSAGWIIEERRMFRSRPAIYEEGMIDSLARRVEEALRNAIADRPAEPGPLALALIATQARMPFIATIGDDPQYFLALREMMLATIEPVLALHRVIQQHTVTPSWGGGGCGGGGCGGGGCGGGGAS